MDPPLDAVSQIIGDERGTLETPVALYEAVEKVTYRMHRRLRLHGTRPRRLEIIELPAVENAVCGVHLGSMEHIAESWQALHAEIFARGLPPLRSVPGTIRPSEFRGSVRLGDRVAAACSSRLKHPRILPVTRRRSWYQSKNFTTASKPCRRLPLHTHLDGDTLRWRIPKRNGKTGHFGLINRYPRLTATTAHRSPRVVRVTRDCGGGCETTYGRPGYAGLRFAGQRGSVPQWLSRFQRSGTQVNGSRRHRAVTAVRSARRIRCPTNRL